MAKGFFIYILSKTISRVMSLNGHLSRPAVAGRLKQPTREQTGRLMLSVRSCFEWGLHGPLLLPGERWSLTPPFHPYTYASVRRADAVYFCCTFPGVASARRYLASCPVKPGLSSPAAFRLLQQRPSVWLKTYRSVSDSRENFKSQFLLSESLCHGSAFALPAAGTSLFCSG